MGLAMTVRVLLALFGTVLLGALAIDMLVLLPLRAEGTLEEFYGPLSADRIFWIWTLVSLWALGNALVMIALVWRLGSRKTWRWNYPNSWWRVLRSIFFVTSLVCLGAVVPGYIVGAPPVAGDSVQVTERTWELWGAVLLVGVFSLLIAAMMYIVGAAVHVLRALTGKKRATVASAATVV